MIVQRPSQEAGPPIPLLTIVSSLLSITIIILSAIAIDFLWLDTIVGSLTLSYHAVIVLTRCWRRRTETRHLHTIIINEPAYSPASIGCLVLLFSLWIIALGTTIQGPQAWIMQPNQDLLSKVRTAADNQGLRIAESVLSGLETIIVCILAAVCVRGRKKESQLRLEESQRPTSLTFENEQSLARSVTVYKWSPLSIEASLRRPQPTFESPSSMKRGYGIQRQDNLSYSPLSSRTGPGTPLTPLGNHGEDGSLGEGEDGNTESALRIRSDTVTSNDTNRSSVTLLSTTPEPPSSELHRTDTMWSSATRVRLSVSGGEIEGRMIESSKYWP